MKIVKRTTKRALLKTLEQEIKRIRYEERYVKPWERKAA